MKKFIQNFIFFSTTFIALSTAAQRTYEMQGVILDGITNLPLAGATVYDSVHFNGTSSNIDGRFRLSQLPPGQTTVTISYLGFSRKDTVVSMPEDDNKEFIIMLIPATQVLEGISIIRSFEGQERALNQQRAADNIKNIISADLIGKFPDQNVAEALNRIPGVNISRDKGEGSTVSLRGTPQHFTNISINGEQLSSVQQGGGRTEALDLIPADQLGSIEVTKALTADMDGDAIGGNINLRTPTARSQKLQLRGEAGLGFNDLSGQLNQIGRLRASKRFFSNAQNQRGRVGVLVSGSYYSNNNMEDRMDVRWSGLPKPVESLNQDLIMPLDYQFRKTENKRTRIGATATFDYTVKNHEIVFNYMYNEREDNDIRNRLRFDLDRSNSVWISPDSISRGRIRRDINLWDELKSNHNFNLEGKHSLNSWIIDWGAFYTTSKRNFSSTRGDFSRDDIDIITTNRNGIFDEVPQLTPAGDQWNLKNPLMFNDFRRYEEDFETTDASNLVGRININKDYTVGGNKGNLKFGGKLRKVTNAKFRNNQVLSFFDPNQVLNLEEAFANVAGSTEPLSFLNDRYEYGPRVNSGKFTNYINQYRRLLITADDAWDAERLSKNDTYDATEDVYAGYIMNRYQIKNLLIIAGLRYEFNDVDYNAFEVKRSGTDVVATPVKGGTDYGFLLPSLHLKYNYNPLTNFRFAYTQSYAKPNFVDIVPFINYDADATSLYLGNTELKPSLAHNLDLMYEKYNQNSGIISLGMFYKNMNSFQFTRIIPALPADFPDFPQTAGFQFRQEQNGEEATVYGLEVNVMQQLNRLPGLLSGLSVYFNYTFTGSNASTQDRKDMRLPGQAMHTGNASLSFDYKKFTSKASLNYNGAYIYSVASNQNDDIFQADRWQLDLNLSQQINKSFGIYAEFVNLSNSPYKRYQGEEERVSRLAYFGWLARFGATFKL